MSRAVAIAAAIILATEGGVPVPLPADLVLLGLGERAGAGAVPLWVVMAVLELVVAVGTLVLFVLARRLGHRLIERLGSRRPSLSVRVDRVTRILERRGIGALVAGRATPGLRTITVLVAGLSSIPAWVALAALLAGSSVFVQGHVLLGYAIGPAAREILDELPVLGIAMVVILVFAALSVWVIRRGKAGLRGWTEGSCPACLAIGLRDAGA